MDAAVITTMDEAAGALANPGRELPTAAMLWCRANWESAATLALDLLGRCLNLDGRTPEATSILFFLLHLAGERRDPRIFAPLCRLAQDADALEEVLGDGVASTIASIIIGTYDGNAAPLHALIETPTADENVRYQALQAFGFLTASGRISRDAAEAYLRDLSDRLLPREPTFTWFGWVNVIALLRLESLEPLAHQAFERGLIPESILGKGKGYRTVRDDAEAHADPIAGFAHDQIGFLDDAIDELSRWAAFSEDDFDVDADDEGDIVRYDPYTSGPAINPNRHVGRNDPCPCGSGKKFKHCCLK